MKTLSQDKCRTQIDEQSEDETQPETILLYISNQQNNRVLAQIHSFHTHTKKPISLPYCSNTNCDFQASSNIALRDYPKTFLALKKGDKSFGCLITHSPPFTQNIPFRLRNRVSKCVLCGRMTLPFKNRSRFSVCLSVCLRELTVLL